MTKKSKFSSRMARPIESDEEKKSLTEEPKEELLVKVSEDLPAAEESEKKEDKDVPVVSEKAEQLEKSVMDILHGTTPSKKTQVEKNTLPVNLLNQTEQKTKTVEVKGVGKMHDLIEVARQHAAGYQPTWDASLKAYARHMGFPNLASMEDCKTFIVKWGAKLKD